MQYCTLMIQFQEFKREDRAMHHLVNLAGVSRFAKSAQPNTVKATSRGMTLSVF
jgi:hypothetical protein